ncbi:MAG: hypothetical protein ACLSVD_11795 [Eggerthellaceae bacterium]
MSPRKAGKEDAAAAKRAVKDAKAAAKAADKEARRPQSAPGKARGLRRGPGIRAAGTSRSRSGSRTSSASAPPARPRPRGPPRSQGRLQAHRLRRPVRRRHRAGGAGAVQPDGQLRRHQLPEHGDESQKSVCRQMRKLYDGLTRRGLQLLLFNRPLTKGEMSNRRFFGRVEGPAAPYAAEYSRILNDKMAEGVSNIMRERYLTFSVSADTVEESVPSWRACAPWRTACFRACAAAPACCGARNACS